MPRKLHRTYMRLVDNPPLQLPVEEQLAAVKQAVEALGEIEWIAPPRLHPRGGFVIQIGTADKPDVQTWQTWAEELDRAGFRNSV